MPKLTVAFRAMVAARRPTVFKLAVASDIAYPASPPLASAIPFRYSPKEVLLWEIVSANLDLEDLSVSLLYSLMALFTPERPWACSAISVKLIESAMIFPINYSLMVLDKYVKLNLAL